jgi:hypothetical protein
VAVGLIGFWLHTLANLHGTSPHWLDNFIHGAPAMAPLLFPNLVLLAGLGLWILGMGMGESAEQGRAVGH